MTARVPMRSASLPASGAASAPATPPPFGGVAQRNDQQHPSGVPGLGERRDESRATLGRREIGGQDREKRLAVVKARDRHAGSDREEPEQLASGHRYTVARIVPSLK